nr:SH3 domain-containing protein [Lutimaribacter sp. EGI FJ00013]
MRMGPGTKFNVATTLRRGDLVEVLDDPGTGWLNLRVVDTGRVGWIADFLVTAGLD